MGGLLVCSNPGGTFQALLPGLATARKNVFLALDLLLASDRAG